MSNRVRYLPPRGHYLAHEVGRLAGVSGQTVGQWARRGYIRSSQSEGRPRVYSYQDVAEALIVHELLERGIEHRQIKETIRNLRDRTANSWPLTSANLATAGKRVIRAEESALYDVSNIPWHQMALEPSDVARIAGELRRGGWAARERPNLTQIEVDPERLSGRPVIRGTRVPAELVAELARQPGGREELRDGYDVDEPAIEDALAWWQTVQAYEEAA